MKSYSKIKVLLTGNQQVFVNHFFKNELDKVVGMVFETDAIISGPSLTVILDADGIPLYENHEEKLSELA